MNTEKILIIEDEFQMRYLLRTHLESQFHLTEASNGEEGLKLLEQDQFSLIILDIMMEGRDGWEVCKKVRDAGNQIPILMLTARSDVKEKVQGLTLGADDYVVKPFDSDELIARIRALLRRSDVKQGDENTRDDLVKMEGLEIDPQSREVYVNGKLVELTLKEFDLLFLLASSPNWVYTRDILLDKIWGQTKILDVRTVDSHVKHIRDKLKIAGLSYQPIKTVWGVGYKFNLPAGKQ